MLFCERVESIYEFETKLENIYKEEGKQEKIDKGVEKKKNPLLISMPSTLTDGREETKEHHYLKIHTTASLFKDCVYERSGR